MIVYMVVSIISKWKSPVGLDYYNSFIVNQKNAIVVDESGKYIHTVFYPKNRVRRSRSKLLLSGSFTNHGFYDDDLVVLTHFPLNILSGTVSAFYARVELTDVPDNNYFFYVVEIASDDYDPFGVTIGPDNSSSEDDESDSSSEDLHMPELEYVVNDGNGQRTHVSPQ